MILMSFLTSTSIWIRSIHLVNFNVFVSEALASSLGINFQVIGVLDGLSLAVVEVIDAALQPVQGLLCPLLVQNVQVGTVGRLDRDDEALLI